MKKVVIGMLVGSMVLANSAFAFSDVSEDFWAHDKIQEMYESGIVSGFEDGTFKPNNKLTREQAASIMANFFELSPKGALKKFNDIPEGYWSEEAAGLVGEYMPVDEVEGGYYFRPFDDAKRVEIAEAIIKVIGYDNQEPDYEVIEKFNDKDTFSENDKKYIALVAKNNIMVGDDLLNFRPNDTITRAEFCSLIYNIYLMRNDLKSAYNDKAALIINGEEISYDEFNLYFGVQKKAYESMFGSADIWTQEIDGVSVYDTVKDATMDGIILNRVKIQKANEMGVKIPEDVEKSLQEYVKSNMGKEICEFYSITEDELYKINAEGALIEELMNSMYNSMDHSEHDHININEPIDTMKYSARHILLSTEGLSEEEKATVKETAEGLLERVKNGEDFAALANEHSIDGGSNTNGGLYEDVLMGQFVPEFEEAALSLSEGTIYPELVESSYGYHIIKLESKEKTTRDATDEEKHKIMEEDLEPTIQEWLDNAEVEQKEEIYELL